MAYRTSSKRIVFSLLATVALIAPVAVSSTTTVASAATNVRPNKSVLKHNKSYYKKHLKALKKKYRISTASQTGLSKTGTISVYDKTGNKYLHASLQQAAAYWNAKLGRKAIKLGTKKNHTVVFKMYNEKHARKDGADAWWSPDEKQLVTVKYYYDSALSDIKSTMSLDINSHYATKASNRLTDYRNSLISAGTYDQATIDQMTDTYKAQLIKFYDPYQQTAIDNMNTYVANKARTYEYAATLAHELGHALGLNHSPNSKDLMYYASGSDNIYDYFKVKNGFGQYNPVTATDRDRAKLAVKIRAAI